MNAERFDSITRLLAARPSRRRMLGTALAGAGGAVLARAGWGGRAGMAAARTPAIVEGPTASPNGARVVVRWRTDQPTDGVVDFGTGKVFGSEAVSGTATKEHVAVLEDLARGETYRYRVRSRNEFGAAMSATMLFVAPTGDGDGDDATGDDRTLLASYRFRSYGDVPYETVVYRPRQFDAGIVLVDSDVGPLTVGDAGPYSGWDVLRPWNEGTAIWTDWLRLRLNRAATLAVVWRAGEPLPTWLRTWERGDDVVVSEQTLPTYRGSFAAGEVALGGVYDPDERPEGGRPTYWVLLAEEGGVPAGMETPRPNEVCPDWVHDRHRATGPDGRPYATWHPQIDPVYWCYFGHEHGSDPTHFAAGYANAFGYVAATHQMDEPHVGFKNMVFDSEGIRWWLSFHFGTGGLARACARFHSLDVAALDIASGELLADVRFMADFGIARLNAGDAPLTPPTCPEQAAAAGTSEGVRKLPSADHGGTGYEPWRPDFAGLVVGLGGSLVLNTPDPVVICNTAVCDEPIETGGTGSIRFLDANGFTIEAGRGNAGVFYTDPLGRDFLAEDDPEAVLQFLKPGLRLTLEHGDKCADVEAWGRPYVCDGATHAAPTAREGSIRGPN